MSREGAPLVHVVVVDYDGGDLTLACLRSLLAADWPADRLRVVLVDNGSRHPVTDVVARTLPAVRCLTSRENRGFAGGSNLGLAERGDADFVALVNNDATVAPGWLPPLVATFAAGDRIGAACPKILLADPAIDIGLAVDTHRRGRGDRRALGVRVSGARVGGTDVWRRTRLVQGFWGYEPMPAGEAGGQWTAGRALVRLPVPAAAEPHYELRLAAADPVVVTTASGTVTAALAVGRDPAWFTVPSDAPARDVVNNVGTIVGPDGFGSDRGWLEPDDGQYDEPADVDAWCGAAVLLARAYLDDVGPLDERLFHYYEDVELSLRGARRGWRYRTAPESVVRHVHSATSVEGSPFARFQNERNRLLVAGEAGSPVAAARLLGRHLAITGSYALRDVVCPVLHGHAPRAEIVGSRLHALGAAAIRLPGRRASGRPGRPGSGPPAPPR